ncbi:probable PIH1 domain-containing protein 1 at N-terminal half [Coccomyxa sp. Obi]|nr:probable PIH1 domain-containing protein 1 at N-terminal half [Coccomyxa sp. Obi]
MNQSGSAPLSDGDCEDLSNLVKQYMSADGIIEPEKAPPDMRDLLARLQDIQKQARSTQQQGVTVTPEPGFVIKTVDEKGRKVFINVCGSSSVLAPGGWKNGQMSEEVRTALERAELEDPGDILRFPLSMGDLRMDRDHSGEACHVLDIVFNNDVLKQAQTFRKLKIFLVELAMGWATKKHSVALSPNWKLPKLRYKGDKVVSQRLRLDRKPLVTDLGDVMEKPSFPLVADKKQTPVTPASAAKKGPAKEGPSGTLKKDQVPEKPGSTSAPAAAPSSSFSFSSEKQGGQPQEQGIPSHEVQYQGRPAEAVQVSVCIEQTDPSSSDQVSVQVHLDQVIVKVPGYAPLKLSLPFAVDANLGKAEITDGGKNLLLLLPFKPYRSFIEEMKLEGNGPTDYMHCSYMQMEA